MTTSTTTIGLTASRQQQLLFRGLTGLLLLSVLAWPAQSAWLWLGFLLLIPSFYGLHQAAQAQSPRFFTLEQQTVRWHHDVLPAGQLLKGSVICRVGAWLCWQDANGLRHRQWLFADQFSSADFCVLGRVCQQLNWR